MSVFDVIEGQPAAVRTLERALSSDRVASAYLFVGPSGVGKEKTAVALSRALVAPEDPAAQDRIVRGHHPDVRVFAPREQASGNIPVDFVRNEIRPFTQFAPFEGRAAVVVFPRADVSFPETHPEAANALLKTLEEPHTGVHFVLCSERPDRLLPTIRSRCQRVTFGRLSTGIIERVLIEHDVAQEQRAAALALSDGRADRALELAQAETAQSLLELAIRVDEAVEQGRPGTLVDLAAEMARGERLPLTLETLATYYRDVACVALGLEDDALAFRHLADTLRERARRLGPGRAARRVELLQETSDALERNVNAEIALDALLTSLRDAA